MKNLLISISLMSTMLFIKCKKTGAVHETIDSFLTNHFNYKPGTYWIYIDSITGEQDSFVVNDNTFSSSGPTGNSSVLTDGIGMHIYQYNSLKVKTATWNMTLTGREIAMTYNGNIYIDYYAFVLLPFQAELLGYGDEDSGYIESINNSYMYNYKTYTDVVKIRHINDYDPVFAHFNNTFYFNKEIGIIKMLLEQDVTNIWELERYKIVK